jgi:hypothetical protein
MSTSPMSYKPLTRTLSLSVASSQIEIESLEKSFQSILHQFGIENNSTHKDHAQYQTMVKTYSEQSIVGENYEKMHNFLTILKPLAQWQSHQSVES